MLVCSHEISWAMALVELRKWVSSWILEQKKASITRHPTSCTMEKLQLFPSGGTGRHGGNCHLEELPNIGSSQQLLKTPFEYNTVINVLLVKQNKSEAWNLNLLNVTGMTVLRRDGHSSLYYLCPRLDQLLSITKTATTGLPD